MTELYVGMNLAIFINQSITIRIMSFLDADFGTGPRLSMPRDSQGCPGIGSGCNRPAGG